MNPFRSRRLQIVVIINLAIAALQVIGPGRQTPGLWRDLSVSYFSDLVMPLGFYFLLCALDRRTQFLRPAWRKASAVFGACALVETLQFFGLPVLGATFDPVDLVMYATGVTLAAVIERGLLTRLAGWNNE